MSEEEKLCGSFLKELKDDSQHCIDLDKIICVSDKKLMHDLKNIKLNRIVKSTNPFQWK